jgi:hypothetical protein
MHVNDVGICELCDDVICDKRWGLNFCVNYEYLRVNLGKKLAEICGKEPLVWQL